MLINYTLDSKNRIMSVTYFPINLNDLTIDISEEESQSIEIGKSKIVDNKVIMGDTYNKSVEKILILEALKIEMDNIKSWLADNDYIVNKLFLGEYKSTDTRVIEYLSERSSRIARYNELEREIDK